MTNKFYQWWKNHRRVVTFGGFLIILGFTIGVIAIWPGIISRNSRKCFFNIIKDGSDGNIQI